MPSHVVMRMHDESGVPRRSSRAFSFQGNLYRCMAWSPGSRTLSAMQSGRHANLARSQPGTGRGSVRVWNEKGAWCAMPVHLRPLLP